jgi:hypothetical protein
MALAGTVDKSGQRKLRLFPAVVIAVLIAASFTVSRPAQAQTTASFSVVCHDPHGSFWVNGAIPGYLGERISWRVWYQNQNTGQWFADIAYTTGQVTPLGRASVNVIAQGWRSSGDAKIKVFLEVKRARGSTTFYSPTVYTQYYYGLANHHNVVSCTT